MNKDFHYYGTYVAARLAGYDFKSAELLAHAAQYVDDSENSRLKDDKGQFYIKDFVPVPTVHSFGELIAGNVSWTEAFLDETERVWPVFHFLPGNYNAAGNYIKPYNGKLSDKGILGALWEYDDEAKEQFKLMCLPNSIAVKRMVDTLMYGSSLHEIGLRMHTLADTWAHMYYSGVAAWFTNDVMEGGPPITELPIPPTPHYNSYSYLGHCRCGHYPDYPYKKFDFRPQWSNVKITKDNPSEFLKALKQMLEALVCIRTGKTFEIDKYAEIDSANEVVLKKILGTVKDDQSDTWKQYIPDIKIAGKSIEVPADYNPDKWLNDAKSSSDIKKTDYYKFNMAAVLHLSFVKGVLKENRIFLDDVPKERILKLNVAHSKDEQIAKAKYYSTPAAAPYPTLSGSPVVLEFVLPNDNKLKHGSIIKIRTTETGSDFGENRYLGAWETPSLYYYVKDYNLFKQKWCIEQQGLKVGDVIDLKKPVWIKNRHFNDKSYLCPYTWFFSKYLSTSATSFEWSLVEVLGAKAVEKVASVDKLKKENGNISATNNKTTGFVMMLDVSGSIRDAIGQIKIDAKAFVSLSKPKDQFGVNQFSDNAAWVYPSGTNPNIVTVSESLGELEAAAEAIEKMPLPFDLTNIGAAIELGNNMISHANTDIKAFVILSDGDGNKGKAPDLVLGNEPPIFVAGLGPWLRKEYFDKLFVKNPNRSKYYHKPQADEMAKVFNDIRALNDDVCLMKNVFNRYNGSNFQIVDSYVTTDSGEVQFSVNWTDKNLKYTSSEYPSLNNCKVTLIDPFGVRSNFRPAIDGDGYCVFNLKNARPGMWRTLIEYCVDRNAGGVVGSFQFGGSTKMEIDIPNVHKAGVPLPVKVGVYENGNPVEGLQFNVKIVKPMVSVSDALIKYGNVLNSMKLRDDKNNDGLSSDIAKLKLFREQKLNDFDILGTKTSFGYLNFNGNGLYETVISDTTVSGSYSVEVEVSGVNPATGKPVCLSQSRSVLVG